MVRRALATIKHFRWKYAIKKKIQTDQWILLLPFLDFVVFITVAVVRLGYAFAWKKLGKMAFCYKIRKTRCFDKYIHPGETNISKLSVFFIKVILKYRKSWKCRPRNALDSRPRDISVLCKNIFEERQKGFRIPQERCSRFYFSYFYLNE